MKVNETENPLKDGTRLSGFVKAAKNAPPRECGHCKWYKQDSCGHPVVVIDPELTHIKLENGRIPVDDKDCCDFFASKRSVFLYALRHGSTELNESNAFRGWVDVPLSEEGRKHVKDAAQFLKNKGISIILSSPLERALETAGIVATEIGIDPNSIFSLHRLLPWNVGELSGKDKNENKEILDHHIDNPEEPLPGGESLKDFGDRFIAGLEAIIEDAEKESSPLLIVCHTSNMVQIEQWAKGEKAYGRPEQVDTVNPGGVIELGKFNNKYFADPVFGKYHEGEYGS